MNATDKQLHLRFEGVLAFVSTRVDIGPYDFQLSRYIDRRLLVTIRRALQKCQCTLKLQSIVVVVHKTRRDSGIERNSTDAIKNISRRENVDTCKSLTHIES
jgi:hypothetical protein